jgi:hypothetical protein
MGQIWVVYCILAFSLFWPRPRRYFWPVSLEGVDLDQNRLIGEMTFLPLDVNHLIMLNISLNILSRAILG